AGPVHAAPVYAEQPQSSRGAADQATPVEAAGNATMAAGATRDEHVSRNAVHAATQVDVPHSRPHSRPPMQPPMQPPRKPPTQPPMQPPPREPVGERIQQCHGDRQPAGTLEHMRMEPWRLSKQPPINVVRGAQVSRRRFTRQQQEWIGSRSAVPQVPTRRLGGSGEARRRIGG
ncbi:unnamed protein product, partial [Closterium sp. NIES-54]